MRTPSDTWQKFIEYRQKYPISPVWTEDTVQDFWREFIDGIKQDINIARFKRYQDLFQEQFTAVQNVTKEEFQSLMPAYAAQVPREMRLDETIYEGLHRLNGWVPFERREKGYLLSMAKGKKWLSAQGKRKIDAEFIKQLHAICMSGVSGTNFDVQEAGLSSVGNFRTTEDYSRMGIGNGYFGNATLKGLDECLEVIHQGETAFRIGQEGDDDYFVQYDPEKKALVLMNTCLFFMDKPDSEIYIHDKEKIKDTLWADMEKEQESSPERSRKLSMISQTQDDHPPLSTRISEEIDLLYKKMDACDALLDENERIWQKLWEIVRFIQTLCRIHPFRDGNTRTLVMLLLPYLLNQSGLGNICILNNPNRLWLYSIEECIGEILDGLVNAQNLTAGIPCDLSLKVKTSDILSLLALEEKTHFYNSLQNFPHQKTEYDYSAFRMFSSMEEKVVNDDPENIFKGPSGDGIQNN